MLAVKEYLYKNLTELSETQHNIMHATYLTMQCNESMDDDLLLASARRIFTGLFEQHFTDGLEVRENVWFIGDMAKGANENWPIILLLYSVAQEGSAQTTGDSRGHGAGDRQLKRRCLPPALQPSDEENIGRTLCPLLLQLPHVTKCRGLSMVLGTYQ